MSFAQDEDTTGNTDLNSVAGISIEVVVFDNARNRLAAWALVDSSSAASWICQDLRNYIRVEHSSVEQPASDIFDDVELQSKGVLEVTWHKKADIPALHKNQFNITESIPRSYHLIIGRDILSSDASILEDSDPICVYTADNQSKESKEKTKERKKEVERESKEHKDRMERKKKEKEKKKGGGRSSADKGEGSSMSNK